MSADGREGVAFGLYTMTGRAVSFLAPWLFFLFVDAFGTDRAGLGGILVVLTAGLAAMLFVRTPAATGPTHPRPSLPHSRVSYRTPAHIVMPEPVRCCTRSPSTLTEHVTSRPTLNTVTLAVLDAGEDSVTCLLHGNATLNSICIMAPEST